MLPLTLLKTAENTPILVELKNGDAYNGLLVSCNMFMNITMKDVVCTASSGDRFWKMPECYVRGNSIKYLRISDEVIDQVSADEKAQRAKFAAGRGGAGRGRGGRFTNGDSGRNGGRGGGRGEGRGGGGRNSGGRGRGRD